MEKERDPILYIDDESENLRGFQFLFKNYYKIYVASSTDDGFEILKNHSIKLIIADQRMPKMTGVDFFEIVAEKYPYIIRIILTGYSDIEAIIKAINKGKIFKYVTKPWDKDEFKLIIENAIWTYNIAVENKDLIQSLKNANIELESANKKLEESNQTLEQKVKVRTEEILKQKKEIEEQRDLAKNQRDQIALQNEELEKHRTKLELLVYDRTVDLIAAKEKAEQSDKLKSAFLANLSHEIRTPMNAIMGFSQLLFHDDVSEADKKEFVEIIIVNSQHLLNLINEILDISRIEAGELLLEFKPCNLNDLITELYTIYNEHKIFLKKSNIGLLVNPDIYKQTVYINTDVNKLRQVLSNIIENAFKFTESGQVEFGYKTLSSFDDDPSTVIFYVKDSGIGIDEESQKIIFERFRKVENNPDKLYRGAGLGLAISKRLVEFLGGKIWVESELNQGSTFYFDLPYNKAQGSSWSEAKVLDQKDKMYNWDDKVILVAEDEPTNYKFIEKALEKTNINLMWAKNGFETFELIKKHKIDLVLMDMRMPIMDGFEATRKIKEYKKEIPIIAQTAYAMDYEKDEILKVGCNDYISKPFAVHELLTIIEKYFV